MVKEKKEKKSENSEDKVASSLKLTKDKEIAYDFATKIYNHLGKVIKSIVLFGSAAKGIAEPRSDIDIIIIIDDCAIQWDEELIAWYREELGKLVRRSNYGKQLHVNTVKLSTWWDEMMRGEPVVINIIRWGEPLIDFGGFFNPLKVLLAQGKLKTTPEMIYITLGRAPDHMLRAKANLIASLEGLYWAFVDASHAALIAAKVSPPSPEHVPAMMKEHLIEKNLLKRRYLDWYKEIYTLTHRILRQDISDINGAEVQKWRDRADEYVREMAFVVKRLKGML